MIAKFAKNLFCVYSEKSMKYILTKLFHLFLFQAKSMRKLQEADFSPRNLLNPSLLRVLKGKSCMKSNVNLFVISYQFSTQGTFRTGFP